MVDTTPAAVCEDPVIFIIKTATNMTPYTIIATAGRLAYRVAEFRMHLGHPLETGRFLGAHRSRNIHFALSSVHAQRCAASPKNGKKSIFLRANKKVGFFRMGTSVTLVSIGKGGSGPLFSGIWSFFLRFFPPE